MLPLKLKSIYIWLINRKVGILIENQNGCIYEGIVELGPEVQIFQIKEM